MTALEYVRDRFCKLPETVPLELIACFEEAVARPPDLTEAVGLCELFRRELLDAGMEPPDETPRPDDLPQRRKRLSSRPKVDTCERCFYCDMPLAPTHQHDHFPIPYRHGGMATVPACVNCHTLKDSVEFDTWPGLGGAVMIGKILKKLTPEERILFAKMVMVAIDSLAMLRDKQQ